MIDTWINTIKLQIQTKQSPKHCEVFTKRKIQFGKNNSTSPITPTNPLVIIVLIHNTYKPTPSNINENVFKLPALAHNRLHQSFLFRSYQFCKLSYAPQDQVSLATSRPLKDFGIALVIPITKLQKRSLEVSLVCIAWVSYLRICQLERMKV